MSGQFFWYDLTTPDPEAAARFYRHVVGWETQAADAPGTDYTLFTVDGQGVAGLKAPPPDLAGPGFRPRWMGYVAVNDVDDTVRRLTEAGGGVHGEPVEVPDVIRFAVVSDPQGAGFLVAHALSTGSMREFPPGTPGTVGWHELCAADWGSAFAFYEKLFGWTKSEAHDMGDMGTYQLFATGAAPVGGMMNKPASMPAPHWGFYFNVAAIETAAERVRSAGGSILNGPVEVPGGLWIVQCADPQGAFFSLVAPKR